LQIEAMKRVTEKFPRAGLMIVGSGSLEAELKSLVARKPYAERIFMAGDVPHPVTLHLINRADILLRTTKFDGDAIAVREARFLQTPVIAADNRMRPEGVHLIPIGDSRALEEKIERIASIPRKTKTEKPDDRSNIAEVLKLYDEILAGK
jgi:glycosyltransferase involved in cell wall biosynthesis